MPPHQTWIAAACAALLGCAVGVEDADPETDPIVIAPVPDAGAAPPADQVGQAPLGPVPPPVVVITYDSGTSSASDARVEVVVIDAGTGGSSGGDGSGSGQGASSSDSSVSTPPPSASADAGSATSDAGTTPPPTTDASSPPTFDAGYTPPEAGPMCQAATCTNSCGLLRRCCNARNECACMSLLGNCTLPSLRP